MKIGFSDSAVLDEICKVLIDNFGKPTEITHETTLNIIAQSLDYADYNEMQTSPDDCCFEILSPEEAYSVADTITCGLTDFFGEFLDIGVFMHIHTLLLEYFKTSAPDLNTDAYYQLKITSGLTLHHKLKAHMRLTEINSLGLTYYFEQNFEHSFEDVALKLKHEQGYDLINEAAELDACLQHMAAALAECNEAA